MLRTDLFCASIACLACAPLCAQEECSRSDDACWDRAFELACAQRETTEQGCSDWLERTLRPRVEPANTKLRLLEAAGNFRLAELTRGTATENAYRERARTIYQALADQKPPVVDALFGLASLASTEDEQVRLMRRVVEVDPTNVFGLYMLARSLGWSNNDARLEAGKLYERAYAAQTGLNKWHLARDAVWAYTDAERLDLAARLKARVRNDLKPDALLAQLADRSTLTPERAANALQVLCYDAVISVLGAKECLRGIDSVAGAVAGSHARVPLAESVADAMRDTGASSSSMTDARPAWRETFRSWLRATRASGVTSAAFERASAEIDDEAFGYEIVVE
jgi:hypothetical protein